jgi:S1-C subfamily serine protease
MPRRLIRAASLALVGSPLMIAALLVAPQAPAGPPGPWVFIPAPGSTAATGTVTTATATPTATLTGKPTATASGSATTATKDDGMERARKATVVIQRGKKPIALGILLSEKNFILTARSPLVAAGTGDLEVILPDSNTLTKAKLVHEDVEWDLALVVPQTTKGLEGAKPSDTDPLSTSVTFSTFVLLKTGKVQAQPTQVLGKRDFLSPEGETLKDALSIETKSLAIGTALVDGNGGVVAMVSRACAPGSPKVAVGGKGVCMPQLFGAPLAIVKKFLKSAPQNVKPFNAFLGVGGTADPLGVKVTDIKPGSPAAVAGLKANEDVIVAFDSAIVRTIDDLHEKVSKKAPGDVVTMLVAKAGVVREVKVTLKGADEAEPGSPTTGTKLPPLATTPLPFPPMPTIVIKPTPKKP